MCIRDRDYDISSWDNADVVCSANEGQYGILKERIIPQFKNYGLRNYDNSAEFEGFPTTEEMTLKIDVYKRQEIH